MTRLVLAYGAHRVRQRLRRHGRGAEELLRLYAPDHLEPLLQSERELLPRMSKCINCGLCALAAHGRLGAVTLPDLASTYLRPLSELSLASSDVRGSVPDLQAAAAACPVGVPLPEVAAMVQRLTRVNA